MGYIMLTLLIAIQNFTVALILAWMGFSVSPDADEKNESMAPAPNSSFVQMISG